MPLSLFFPSEIFFYVINDSRIPTYVARILILNVGHRRSLMQIFILVDIHRLIVGNGLFGHHNLIKNNLLIDSAKNFKSFGKFQSLSINNILPADPSWNSYHSILNGLLFYHTLHRNSIMLPTAILLFRFISSWKFFILIKISFENYLKNYISGVNFENVSINVKEKCW